MNRPTIPELLAATAKVTGASGRRIACRAECSDDATIGKRVFAIAAAACGYERDEIAKVVKRRSRTLGRYLNHAIIECSPHRVMADRVLAFLRRPPIELVESPVDDESASRPRPSDRWKSMEKRGIALSNAAAEGEWAAWLTRPSSIRTQKGLSECRANTHNDKPQEATT